MIVANPIKAAATI